jgi:surfactin synthase thioesterase subunit
MAREWHERQHKPITVDVAAGGSFYLVDERTGRVERVK